MKIKVKFFSLLREEFGVAEKVVEIEGGSRVSDIAILVGIEAGRIEDGSVMTALNFEYCDADAVLKDGDEVAFFPPVSGG
jgi:molybdopterin synthase sulfur carrier subunit